MTQIPIDIQGVTVWRDLRSNRWTIQAPEQTYSLHEWNWGQRRQLVRTAVVSGRFEPGLFIDSIFELLLQPIPAAHRERYAYLALHLLGVPEQPPAMSLARAELLLARSFGWRPTELADQPAAALDDMVQSLAAQDAHSQVARPPASGDEGWISIVVTSNPVAVESDPNTDLDPSSYAEAHLRIRLRHMLDAVAAWAGLSVEPRHLEEPGRGSADLPAQNPTTASANGSSYQDSAWAGLSVEPRHLEEPGRGSADLPAQNPTPTSANGSSYQDSDDAPGNGAKVTAKAQSPGNGAKVTAKAQPLENSGQRGPSGWPDRFAGTARLKTAAISSGNRQHPGHSPVLSTTLDRRFATTGQQPYGPDQPVDEGRTQGSNLVHIPDHASLPQPQALSSQLEIKPAASAGSWGDVGKTEARSSAWPGLATAPRPNKGWEALSATRPRPRRWQAEIGVNSRSPSHVEVAREAGSKPAQPQDWPKEPTYEPNMASIAIQEGYVETGQDTLALAEATVENPFALSEFEERLADALERAAHEAGIDLP